MQKNIYFVLLFHEFDFNIFFSRINFSFSYAYKIIFILNVTYKKIIFFLSIT